MKAQAIKFFSYVSLLRQQYYLLGQTLSINLYRKFVDAILKCLSLCGRLAFEPGVRAAESERLHPLMRGARSPVISSLPRRERQQAHPNLAKKVVAAIAKSLTPVSD